MTTIAVTSTVYMLALAEIREFIRLHRLLYDIVPGTPQPPGMGEDWGVIKQRVYGTLAYAQEGPAWNAELNDPQQLQETLEYIRTKKDALVDRLKAAGKAA